MSTVEIRQQPLRGKPQAAAVSIGHLAAELCFGTDSPPPPPAQPGPELSEAEYHRCLCTAWFSLFAKQPQRHEGKKDAMGEVFLGQGREGLARRALHTEGGMAVMFHITQELFHIFKPVIRSHSFILPKMTGQEQ